MPYGCAEVGHTADSVARRIRCARLIVRLVQVNMNIFSNHGLKQKD
jgi:hypothetical protein